MRRFLSNYFDLLLVVVVVVVVVVKSVLCTSRSVLSRYSAAEAVAANNSSRSSVWLALVPRCTCSQD